MAFGRRVSRITILPALLVAAACAQVQDTVPEPAAKPGSFGVLDSAYSRSDWHWMLNADGRELLVHTRLPKCFVDPKPDNDYNEPGFTVKREQKTIGTARYDVMNVREGGDFWIAVYQRAGSSAPALGVYADGPCREAAENILGAYEKAQGPV